MITLAAYFECGERVRDKILRHAKYWQLADHSLHSRMTWFRGSLITLADWLVLGSHEVV